MDAKEAKLLELFEARLSRVPEAGVRYRSVVLAGRARHVWERKHDQIERYMQVARFDEGTISGVEFTVLAGEYTHANVPGFKPFDARRIGSLELIVEILDDWLIKWTDWNNLAGYPS